MASGNVITIVSVVVALLAVASAVLGFIAHATKLNPNEIQFDESTGVCVYPAKPAHALGISAVALLVAAMAVSTSMVAGSCFGCVKPLPHPQGGASASRRAKGVVCCVSSWILTAVVVSDYVQGVRWNAAATRGAVAMGLYSYGCRYLKGSGFRTAAGLTFLVAGLGIMSFVMLLTPAPAADEAEPKQDGQGQQPPVVAGVGGVVGEARQNQQSASALPPPQGQAYAHAHAHALV